MFHAWNSAGLHQIFTACEVWVLQFPLFSVLGASLCPSVSVQDILRHGYSSPPQAASQTNERDRQWTQKPKESLKISVMNEAQSPSGSEVSLLSCTSASNLNP